MAVTQNTYTGDGTTVLFSFTFPYLETTDIKVSLNGTNTTAYTLANATTIQFNTAPANGAAIRIYRQTDDAALSATFYPGSAIRSSDLNENFTQNLYVTQESSNNATSALSTANTALTNSTTAINTANSAVSTANAASSSAASAVSTANTASANASAAVSTANTAASNAAAAVSTANSASTTANTALSTANTAASNASNAVSTANTAASNASTAINTANSALSAANTANTNASNAVTTANTASSNATAALNAVASSVQYTLVANVASIPASPTNNQAIEIANSTGIESFSPLANRPAGFVGDSGLSVRIQYSSASSTWNWLNYFSIDSETRYLKKSGGTLTGPLTLSADPTLNLQAATKQYVDTVASSGGLPLTGGTMTGAILGDNSTSPTTPGYAFDGDPNTGMYRPGPDELAFSTGGIARLTFDSAGNATFANSVTIPAGSTVTGYLTSATAASTYQTQAGMSSYLTTATAASTYQTQSGMSAYAPLASPTFTGTVTIPAGASISGYLDTTTAASTYQTQAGMSSYLTTASASSTYAPQASPTFTGSIYANGSYRGNVTAVAALNIDCSLGNVFTKSINGASTFTVSNVPASRSYAFTLELTHTSGAITWFSGVVWPGGTAPTLTTGKVHLFMFFTDDGGTTWRASSLINY